MPAAALIMTIALANVKVWHAPSNLRDYTDLVPHVVQCFNHARTQLNNRVTSVRSTGALYDTIVKCIWLIETGSN